MTFASVPIYIKSYTEFINNLERLSGRLVTNVQHCFDVIIVEEPSTKIKKYYILSLQSKAFRFIIILINTTIRSSLCERLVAQEHQGRYIS